MRIEDLKTKLLTMAEDDLRVRAELVASGELFEGYNERMAAVHKKNGESLDRLIGEFGWPGISLVGRDGAEAAWLVLQHAIGSPELQRKCLPMLKKAVEADEIPAAQFACLEDRICVLEGRPQRYGTQFDWDGNGVLSPNPIEDPEEVDERRAAFRLKPLAERIKEVRQRAAEEGSEPPADFRKYIKEREAWARSVGWR
jgi:hypothetical protein